MHSKQSQMAQTRPNTRNSAQSFWGQEHGLTSLPEAVGHRGAV